MAEKEYIEKEKAVRILREEAAAHYPTAFHVGLYAAARAIDSIPAADVRPVVLCRDCKYAPIGDKDGSDLEWPHDDWPEDNPCPCKCADAWYSHKPKPDFFCAAGEKREEN